jgi:histidine triad (HIT) family protein
VSDCIFCRIVAGEIPSRQVWSDDHCIAFHDLSPQAPTHVLIVPRLHVPSVAELGDPLLAGRLVIAAAEIARKLGVDEGYRLLTNRGESAGQSVLHLHWHLLAGRRFGWPPG